MRKLALLMGTVIGLNQLPVQIRNVVPVTVQAEQLGSYHYLVAIPPGTVSQCQPFPTDVWTTCANPIMTNYSAGQFFILQPQGGDMPSGATLSIDGIGPLVTVGDCSLECVVLPTGPSGQPPNEFLVK